MSTYYLIILKFIILAPPCGLWYYRPLTKCGKKVLDRLTPYTLTQVCHPSVVARTLIALNWNFPRNTRVSNRKKGNVILEKIPPSNLEKIIHSSSVWVIMNKIKFHTECGYKNIYLTLRNPPELYRMMVQVIGLLVYVKFKKVFCQL